jgi:hypothetical protein
MRSLGKKLLEAAKESDTTLAKMIVDGKYKPAQEEPETKRTPGYSKKPNRRRNRARFQKKPRSTRPGGAEIKSESVEARPESPETKSEGIEVKS